MQPTPELAHSVARDFARRIADRPEVQSLYASLDEEALVLWLEVDPLENGGETELKLHGLAAEVNDGYPETYVELRVMNPARSRSFAPERVLPRDAERISIREVVSEIDGAEDTRPF